ncbi:cytochrome [Streptomyces sp. NPDC057199]|uniref:cytochrome n=1 Tax=Streptomyces sp. NPDC057199 TaxID=3346047 RepID=UPI00362BE491
MEIAGHAPPDSPVLESLSVEALLTWEFDSDPNGIYERLRGKYGAVAPVGLMGVPVWLVLDYQDVLEVLRNENVWRRDIRYWRARNEGLVPRDWPLLPGYEVRGTMFMDAEEHQHFRRTHQSALRPFQSPHTPQGRALLASVTQYTDDLVALLAAESGMTGFVDLCAQYTRPLLLMVTAKLFGFWGELEDELVMDMWRMVDGGADAGPATGRILEAMTRLAAHRRTNPGDDLPAHMMRANPQLSDEQLGRELLTAAIYLNDATGSMVANTLLEVLLGNAAVRRSLSNGQLGDTLNRVALVNPPIANLPLRFAARDVRLGRFWMRAGDPVTVSVAAAHQNLVAISPSALATSDISTRAHLGWGAGPHQCPSAARELAGMIGTAAVARIFEHFENAELMLPYDQLSWRSGPSVRGLRLLPVRYALRESARPERYVMSAQDGGGIRATQQSATPGAEAKGVLSSLRRLMFGRR